MPSYQFVDCRKASAQFVSYEKRGERTNYTTYTDSSAPVVTVVHTANPDVVYIDTPDGAVAARRSMPVQAINIPEPQDGVFYIVPLAAFEATDRIDVVCAGPQACDAYGNPSYDVISNRITDGFVFKPAAFDKLTSLEFVVPTPEEVDAFKRTARQIWGHGLEQVKSVHVYRNVDEAFADNPNPKDYTRAIYVNPYFAPLVFSTTPEAAS